MNFGSLSSAHQIMVLLSLKGGPEYAARLEAASAETTGLSRSVLRLSAAMDTSTRRSWLHNQALFTARRYAFYTTLAVTGLAYSVARLGFEYNSTVQGAKAALSTIFPNQQALDGVIQRLYKISTLSPFLFKDTVSAFRTLYPAFHAVGISAGTAIDTIQAAANGMAVAGKMSNGQLIRVGLQLQHLANLGRPTGQILLNLARDGLPVQAALRKELGLSADQVHNIASAGVTATQVIKALNKYLITTAPYAGAALRVTTRTLQGNWQMFKDILAQASGRATGGLFTGLTARLRAVNQYLAPMFAANRPIGLYQIAAALDSAISPSTHIVLNLFITFSTALKTMIVLFGVLGKAISIALLPLDALLNMFGLGHAGARLFGVTLGTLATVFIIAKLALMPFMIAIDLFKASVLAAEAVSKIFMVTQALLSANWGLAWALITGNTMAIAENTVAEEVNTLSLREQYDAMIARNAIMGVGIAETEAATTATIAWNASLLTVLGTIGLIIAAVGTMVAVAHHFHTSIIPGGPIFGQHKATPAQVRQNTAFDRHQRHLHFYDPRKWLTVIGGMQHGGITHMGETTMVGENGPEIAHFPAGTRITPMSKANFAAAGTLTIHVYPQDVYLDKRKIATVFAEAVTDKHARS